MMYWIVFALFTCAETFTDVFLSFWFPFYYEIKILLVLWLLSPATKGSSFLYRKFVHPQLAKRERDIDEYLNRAKEHGYHAVLQLGTKGINYASQVLVQTALKGGGHIVNQLHRSYSMADLHSPPAPIFDDGCASDENDTAAEEDSLPLDDFSGRQSFPSVSKLESVSQVRRRESGNGSSSKVDEPSSGYASSDVPDYEKPKNVKNGKSAVKRTKSSPTPPTRSKEKGNTYE
uniref:Receptor expression-enhancing protein n=1 Tax=Strigamia maritima TaxID=126957 RepID=T1JN40_STRMM